MEEYRSAKSVEIGEHVDYFVNIQAQMDDLRVGIEKLVDYFMDNSFESFDNKVAVVIDS